MARKGKQNGNGTIDARMVHDPLAEVDELASISDDLLEGEWLPKAPTAVTSPAAALADAAPAAEIADKEPSDVGVPPSPSPRVTPDPVASVQTEAVAVGAGISLGSSLTIRDVAEIYPLLLQALDGGSGQLILLAEDLDQVDGAGVQLLATVVQEAQKRGTELCWQGVPPSLRQAAAAMGLSALFGWS